MAENTRTAVALKAKATSARRPQKGWVARTNVAWQQEGKPAPETVR